MIPDPKLYLIGFEVVHRDKEKGNFSNPMLISKEKQKLKIPRSIHDEARRSLDSGSTSKGHKKELSKSTKTQRYDERPKSHVTIRKHDINIPRGSRSTSKEKPNKKQKDLISQIISKYSERLKTHINCSPKNRDKTASPQSKSSRGSSISNDEKMRKDLQQLYRKDILPQKCPHTPWENSNKIAKDTSRRDRARTNINFSSIDFYKQSNKVKEQAFNNKKKEQPRQKISKNAGTTKTTTKKKENETYSVKWKTLLNKTQGKWKLKESQTRNHKRQITFDDANNNVKDLQSSVIQRTPKFATNSNRSGEKSQCKDPSKKIEEIMLAYIRGVKNKTGNAFNSSRSKSNKTASYSNNWHNPSH